MKDQFSGGGIVVDNAIGFWIHRVYQASRNEMYRVFRAPGEATFRDAPTMSRIVDGMEKRGLLVRRAHASDGRVRVVHLTKQGRALQHKLVPLVEQIVLRMVDGIDDRVLAHGDVSH